MGIFAKVCKEVNDDGAVGPVKRQVLKYFCITKAGSGGTPTVVFRDGVNDTTGKFTVQAGTTGVMAFLDMPFENGIYVAVTGTTKPYVLVGYD